MATIAHGTSIEREVGFAKKKWKELKAYGNDETATAVAKKVYNDLKETAKAQQAIAFQKSKESNSKYIKAISKKIKQIEILKLKVARWTTQKPNAGQLEKIAREKSLIKELEKLTGTKYVAGKVSASAPLVLPTPTNPPQTEEAAAEQLEEQPDHTEDSKKRKRSTLDEAESLKEEWHKLKAEGAEKAVIKSAKRKYKAAKKK